MVRRYGIICALAFAVLPVAAFADGVDFTVPDHYLVSAPPQGVRLPGVYRVWERYLNRVRHSIVVSASPPNGDLPAVVDAMVASVKGRHAIDVSREDAAPLCGAPSVRITYSYAEQLTYVYRYVVVAGRLLVASYAHPLGTEPDQPALAALETLCSGVHQPAGPKGWTITAPYPPNASAWRATPDSQSLVNQSARPAEAGHDLSADPFKGQVTVSSDRRDTCGPATIHRVTGTFDDGRILEFAAGTVRGIDYVVAYTRPSSTPADPGAMETLTSFCTNAPTRSQP